MIKFELLNIELPSVNEVYKISGRKLYIPFKFKQVGERIVKQIKHFRNIDEDKKFMENQPLKIKIIVYDKWFNKNGTIKRKDIANKEKFLVDKIFETYNLDDKLIFSISLTKIHETKEPRVVVEIDRVLKEEK